MVNAIYITDNRGATLELRLTDPYNNGIYVNKVEGLGYPQTNINSSKISTYDVALYNSQEVSERNIVLTLGLIGAPSVEGSRHLLYEYLPIRYPILVEFSTDERIAYVTGYVETIEPDIFNSQEVIQVSIICLDPYFHVGGSLKTYIQNGNTYPNFQFESWFTDGAKPVGLIDDEMVVEINSRFQNPPGFSLLIHARDGGFDRAEIEYEDGTIIVNNRILDPYKEDASIGENLFQPFDDLLIVNNIDKISIEKITSDGKVIDLFDKMLLNEDLPSLKNGQNRFNIVTYGIVELRSSKILYNMNKGKKIETSHVIKIQDANGVEYYSVGPDLSKGMLVKNNAYEIIIDFVDGSCRWILNPLEKEIYDINDINVSDLIRQTDDNTLYYYYRGSSAFGDGYRYYQLAYRLFDNSELKYINNKNIFKFQNIGAFGLYLIERSYGNIVKVYNPIVKIFGFSTPSEWFIKHLWQHSSDFYYITATCLVLKYSEGEVFDTLRYTNTNAFIDVLIEHDDIYDAL